MNLLRKPGAVVVAALALAVLPSGAFAHDGAHPFANCTEAYAHGYANIAAGDEHYGTHLDRDRDGIGCDRPPADFVPAKDATEGSAGGEDKVTGEKAADEKAGSAGVDDTDLAETGGDADTTVYLAAGGSAVLLSGAAVLMAARRRQSER